MTQQSARETLAEQAHVMWAHWMRYMFSQCGATDDGSVLIPPHLAKRWQGQMDTAYRDLSEIERKSDRKQADRSLSALAAAGYPVEALADERDELKAELARTRQTLESVAPAYRHIPVHDTDRKPTL